METKAGWYADRLRRKEAIWWKRLIDRQAPYRWKLENLDLGFVLDVGCGLGRNLSNLGGKGVGIDHNTECVAEARRRGFTAFTSHEFAQSEFASNGRFDSILLSHILEHLTEAQGQQIIHEFLRYLRRPGGKVVMITPQQAGYRTDPTHKTYLGLDDLAQMAEQASLRVVHQESFPFPPWVGRYAFPYNENILVAETA